MSNIKENAITLMLVSAMILFIIGCSAPATPEQVLETTISELAQAKVKGDWGKVYDYFPLDINPRSKRKIF